MATPDLVPAAAPRRFATLVLLVVGLLVAAAHVLGAGPMRGALWGANLYAFLPKAALVLATLALAGAAWAALARPSRLDRLLLTLPDPAAIAPRRRVLAIALAMVVCAATFWLLRIRHAFLGDAGPLGESLALGNRFHAHEPLTMVVHHRLYRATRDWFPGMDAAGAARETVALGSVIAGALWVLVALGLAAELSRGRRAGETDRPHPARFWLVLLILLSQGYAQLYFGYVENYTYAALALGAYAWAALLCLRGRAPLWTCAAALVLAVCFDLSSVILAPSFLVLVAVDARRLGAKRALVPLGISLLLAVAAERGLAALGDGFDLAGEIARMAMLAMRGHGPGPADATHLASLAHLADVLNEHVLIGPLGLVFLVPIGAYWLLTRRSRRVDSVASPFAAFLLTAAACAAVASWATGDLNLGYPRDWDLFAPFGLFFTVATLALLVPWPWERGSVERWLFLALALSLYHTVPWIAVNACESRGLARLKTLPSGLGRTEVVVGRWYMTHGQPAEARAWFERAIQTEAANSAAHYCLGLIALDQGRYDDAGRSFWIALRLRPDKDDYRLRLVDALVRSGRPEWARPQLDTLLMHRPSEPRYLAALGIVAMGLGDRAAARAALARAVALAPARAEYRDALARVDDADGFSQALWRDWHAAAGD